jgi:hypothetical protein
MFLIKLIVRSFDKLFTKRNGILAYFSLSLSLFTRQQAIDFYGQFSPNQNLVMCFSLSRLTHFFPFYAEQQFTVAYIFLFPFSFLSVFQCFSLARLFASPYLCQCV